MREINRRKALTLYEALARLDDVYVVRPQIQDRSPMNVVFNLRRADLLPRFLHDAQSAGLHGLEGHRSVGGIRASLYNAVTPQAVDALVDFMESTQATFR